MSAGLPQLISVGIRRPRHTFRLISKQATHGSDGDVKDQNYLLGIFETGLGGTFGGFGSCSPSFCSVFNLDDRRCRQDEEYVIDQLFPLNDLCVPLFHLLNETNHRRSTGRGTPRARWLSTAVVMEVAVLSSTLSIQKHGSGRGFTGRTAQKF